MWSCEKVDYFTKGAQEAAELSRLLLLTATSSLLLLLLLLLTHFCLFSRYSLLRSLSLPTLVHGHGLSTFFSSIIDGFLASRSNIRVAHHASVVLLRSMYLLFLFTIRSEVVRFVFSIALALATTAIHAGSLHLSSLVLGRLLLGNLEMLCWTIDSSAWR